MLACLGRQGRAASVARVAAWGVLFGSAWLVVVGGALGSYLGPIARDGIHEAVLAVSGTQESRSVRGPKESTPLAEGMVVATSALLWLAMLAPAARAALRGRLMPGMGLSAFFVIGAAAYPALMIALLAPNSPTTREIAMRATTFVFLPLALMAGAWLAPRSLTRLHATLAVLTVLFVGGVVLGYSPPWQRVPGPYLVAADQRSVDRESLGAARWARTHLPEDSRVAADRVNGALMNAIGRLSPLTKGSGGVNVAPLYTDRDFNPFLEDLVRTNRIRYVVVDRRLADGLPRFGNYFEPTGMPTDRLTGEQLSKFDGEAGIARIYDNGSIAIYDLGGLFQSPDARSARPTSRITDGGLALRMAMSCCAIALAFLIRKRLRFDSVTLVTLLATSTVVTILGTLIATVGSMPGPPTALLAVIAVLFANWCRTDEVHPPAARTASSRHLAPWFVAVTLTVIAVAGATESARVALRPPGTPVIELQGMVQP